MFNVHAHETIDVCNISSLSFLYGRRLHSLLFIFIIRFGFMLTSSKTLGVREMENAEDKMPVISMRHSMINVCNGKWYSPPLFEMTLIHYTYVYLPFFSNFQFVAMPFPEWFEIRTIFIYWIAIGALIEYHFSFLPCYRKSSLFLLIFRKSILF